MEIPERIEVDDGQRVIMAWPDGFTAEFPAGFLREACPCASCGEPRGEQATKRDVEAGVRIAGAALVGAYAINLTFSSGHSTGIYPFDRLRELADTLS